MNTKAVIRSALFVFFAVFSGCTSIAPVAANLPAVVLDNQQSLHYYGSTFTVTLPKGRYEPAYQTDEGIFYTAPTFIVIQAIGHTADSGGLFLPWPNNPDQRQGFWLQSPSPGHYTVMRDPLHFRYSP